MALVICAECGAKISQRAEQCPSCGVPCIPMSDEQYAARVRSMEAARAHDFKVTIGLIGVVLLLGFVITQLDGGCEAARDRQLRQTDRENQQWQAEQQRKAREEDVRRAREMWNR